MPTDIEVQDAPPVVADDQEAIEHVESESQDGDEIHGGYRFGDCDRKASQRWAGSGTLGARLIQREMVVSDTSKPSMRSSPWMHGAPKLDSPRTSERSTHGSVWKFSDRHRLSFVLAEHGPIRFESGPVPPSNRCPRHSSSPCGIHWPESNRRTYY